MDLNRLSASPLWQQWYVQHQWVIDSLMLGEIGLISKTTWHGWNFRHQIPKLQRVLLLDWLGILLIQTSLGTCR